MPRSEWNVIYPKTDPFARFGRVGAEIRNRLRDFAEDAHSDLAEYPDDAGTGYVRTGELGIRWTIHGPESKGRRLSVIISNNLEYASRVQGPKQWDQFRRIGWPSVTTVAEKQWPRHKPRIIDAVVGRKISFR